MLGDVDGGVAVAGGIDDDGGNGCGDDDDAGGVVGGAYTENRTVHFKNVSFNTRARGFSYKIQVFWLFNVQCWLND